ncbi:glycoside hydrolase family 140 protein [Pseudactinotalea sp.]|uniref:glycoside hydrolase family 140 protein n=1 Tax=Pseudactinotalea sp. TaxID=1926260 RepID=UPI003B3ABE35
MKPWQHGRLEVAQGGHYFQHTDGTPFFWQADTAWLVLSRLTLEEAAELFADRRAKGFNVVQVMVIHSLQTTTLAGRAPFIDGDLTRPDDGSGSQPSFWEHLDAVLDLADDAGLYLALVPIWGSNVKNGQHPAEHVETYAGWLARRYRRHPNIIWLNGGDVHGTSQMEAWQRAGAALRTADPTRLITFHPFGRCQSSTWFHEAHWLDFNMVQSGHRDYEQVWEEDPTGWKGPDTWRYVEQDYQRWPAKPTVDGEPCYEDLPRGLHDPVHGYWGHDDSRRFAYWAVFAGAAGHTYGHNAVIQVYKPEHKPAYGTTMTWREGMAASGSNDLQHLHRLLLSYPYVDRIPDQTVIVGDPGFQKDRLVVTRGSDYLFAYRFTGRPYELRSGVLPGETLRVRWMDPITGEITTAGTIANDGTLAFAPPVGAAGNTDTVLILDAQGS